MSLTHIAAHHISFTYEGSAEPLFTNVSVSIPPGWTAVVGDNGIGKSTFMRIISGAMGPDSGIITPDPANIVWSYCPQNIDVPPAQLDDFAADWSPEVIALRDMLGIQDDWLYRYTTLSGGERKRMQIACAMASNPDVLILDEPTNHVDAPTRQAIITAMQHFTSRHRTSTANVTHHRIGIVVSHDSTLIDATCEQCIVFERRYSAEQGSIQTVVNTYPGTWSQVRERIHNSHRHDAEALQQARNTVQSLQAVQRSRQVASSHAEARKAQGWRIDRHDHDARDAHKLAKRTSADSATGRQVAQMTSKIARAQQAVDRISVAAKRYDGNIWLDIEPSHQCELIHLEPHILWFDTAIDSSQYEVHTNNESNNDNSSADSVIELPLATLHQDRNSWYICAPSTTSSTPSLVAQGLRIGKVSIGPRDHIVITGPNGCGKSTLIEALIHHAQCQHVLYIPQNTTELHIQQAFAQLDALPQAARSQVLSAYAQLNADPDKLLTLKHPSPGELRKLLLCLGIQSRPELIVMDEPTNHLDWSSIEVLGQALAQYAGALIVVTHHEYFANLLQTDIA